MCVVHGREIIINVVCNKIRKGHSIRADGSLLGEWRAIRRFRCGVRERPDTY